MTIARAAAALGLAAVSVLAPALAPALIPAASAACSPVEVVFARGRQEPAGAGVIGNAFVGALRSKVNRGVSLYAVRYPADTQVDIGANDMSAHVQSTINGCPDTRIVLGGYSLGAAVTDVVMAAPISAFGFNNPLPPGADQHIAAVALFGNGSNWVGPIANLNPVYNDRTIDLCHGADPICNPADPHTWQNNWSQHMAGGYIQDGMVNQAADFVAGKLG
ncbi:cutinase [Mycobacterium sp. 1245111.1]|uniref:cutinase family protein n=1 Tax=Mycobacterium sp. 1245111.1 TaxID=1834073 RepID=UPI0007FF40EA|nr:cutinase family protein [Mycobacterium sp. 1245111.1]OBK32464.1 cutinase [Mycobacterium sp. 1245111.1]